jgi:hypothetical protein
MLAALSRQWSAGNCQGATTYPSGFANVPSCVSCKMHIPLKVVSDSDLIPVAGSDVKPVVFGAKRRWRSYRA